jgi:hypothetical protein
VFDHLWCAHPHGSSAALGDTGRTALGSNPDTAQLFIALTWRAGVLILQCMSFDISHLLDDWEYQSGQVVVRKFKGADGKEKIQLRVDLGLL